MEEPPAHASVCALVSDSAGRLDAALALQRRRPDVVVSYSGRLPKGLERALETRTDWIWVLDGSTTPQPDALLALLEALDRARRLPQPSVLAGFVLTPDGELDRALAAWYRRSPTEAAMRAVEERLLPIRATPGPILVHRPAVEQAGGPRRKLQGAGAMLEWTARLLRIHTGYWVPQSEHLAVRPARDGARGPLAAAALLLGGAFAGADRLRVGVDLLERATSSESAAPS